MMLNIKDSSEKILSYFLCNNIYVKKGQEKNLLILLIDFNNYGSNCIRHYLPMRRVKDKDIQNYLKETNLINNDPFEFFSNKLKYIELAYKLKLIEADIYMLNVLIDIDPSLSKIIKKDSYGVCYLPDNAYNRKLHSLYAYFYYITDKEKEDIISMFNMARGGYNGDV